MIAKIPLALKFKHCPLVGHCTVSRYYLLRVSCVAQSVLVILFRINMDHNHPPKNFLATQILT